MGGEVGGDSPIQDLEEVVGRMFTKYFCLYPILQQPKRFSSHSTHVSIQEGSTSVRYNMFLQALLQHYLLKLTLKNNKGKRKRYNASLQCSMLNLIRMYKNKQ